MTCPLCSARKARRSCPALGKSICPVCCGTKRLTEIHCPQDCVYLAAAREHPPVAVKRQQQQDTSRLMHAMRDLNRNQSRLFLSVNAYISQYRPPDIQPLIDADVVEAVVALADTFDTAARGLIYDHRPASRQAERLVSALKPLLDEAIRAGGSTVPRDASVVLRRIAESADSATPTDPIAGGRRREFLDLLSRVFRPRPGEANRAAGEVDDDPRLILP